MATRNQLDSSSTYWRWVQRWKRGLAVAVLVSAALILPSLIASYALEEVAAALGASSWWQTAAGVIGLSLAGPLIIGSRDLLNMIGRLARTPDD